MLFTENIDYYPVEQPGKGGPIFLNLLSLKSGQTGVYEITLESENLNPLFLIWKVTEGNVKDTRYNGNAVTWSNANHIRAGDCYNGNTGLLLVSDKVTTLELVSDFGINGDNLEYFAYSEIIGDPIFPTRVIDSVKDSYARIVRETTTGKVKSTKRSRSKIFQGTIQCKSDEPYIGETFEKLDALDTSFTIWPCGLDKFDEDALPIYRRPGYGVIVGITEYTGPTGYDKGLDSGHAIDLKLTFKEAIR